MHTKIFFACSIRRLLLLNVVLLTGCGGSPHLKRADWERLWSEVNAGACPSVRVADARDSRAWFVGLPEMHKPVYSDVVTWVSQAATFIPKEKLLGAPVEGDPGSPDLSLSLVKSYLYPSGTAMTATVVLRLEHHGQGRVQHYRGSASAVNVFGANGEFQSAADDALSQAIVSFKADYAAYCRVRS